MLGEEHFDARRTDKNHIQDLLTKDIGVNNLSDKAVSHECEGEYGSAHSPSNCISGSSRCVSPISAGENMSGDWEFLEASH